MLTVSPPPRGKLLFIHFGSSRGRASSFGRRCQAGGLTQRVGFRVVFRLSSFVVLSSEYDDDMNLPMCTRTGWSIVISQMLVGEPPVMWPRSSSFLR